MNEGLLMDQLANEATNGSAEVTTHNLDFVIVGAGVSGINAVRRPESRPPDPPGH